MPLTLAEARMRSGDLQQVSYTLALDLTDRERFHSVVTVRFRSDSGTTFLDLAGASGLEVTVDGTAVESPLYDGARLALTGLASGHLHEVTVGAFLPYVTDGEGMHTFTDPVDQERYVGAYLGVDLTQRVFACFDQPDVKATVSLTVLAEPGWTVLANGQVVGATGDRWTFAPTRPIPINQFVVCAGRWASITWTDEDREFGWHARDSLAVALARDIADLRHVTMSCFAYYGRIFTTPYAFGSYHQVFVPGQNWGAQETPGCVMYQEELLPGTIDSSTRQTRASTIAHEMAHMWFGNLATMRWYEDIWLNESFADYLGFRVASDAAGYPLAPVDFEIARKPFGYVADGRRSTHPVAATSDDVPDSAAAASNFDAISYAKGNALIRQLATWLGDERFFEGVNTYLQRYAFANGGLEDFVGCLATAAPHHDVVGWAQSWLCTTGFDTIQVIDTESGPAVRRRGNRHHRISVVAYDDSLTAVDVRQIEVGADPVLLPGWQDHVILPNARGETFARIEPRTEDDDSLRHQVSRVMDPVHRAQIWSNAFARLHARELSPLDFFAGVESQLPHESEPSIVLPVLRWTLGRGLQVCGTHEEVRAGFEAVATACRARLSRAAGTADPTTTAFVDGAVRACRDAAALHGWHEQGNIDGAPLSVEQRWVLIWRMVELGVATPDLLADSSSPHDSAQVRDWAERARAALPDTDARCAAWAAVEDDRVSNRRLGAILDGLWSTGRGTLPPEQIAAYLTRAQPLAVRRGPGFAALLGSHHPGLALSSDQLQVLSEALSDELEPRLRRQWQDWYDDLGVRRLIQ